MGQLSIQLPEQRKSYKEKSKDDFKWARDVVDAIAINVYQYNGEGNEYHTDIQRKLVNYRLYNNELDQKDFEQDCNPFGLTAEEFKDKIQPYNKLYNKVNVLLGEELKRPFNIRTYLVNSSAVSAYTRAKTEMNKQYVQYKLNSEIANYKAQIAQQLGSPETEEEANKFMQEVEDQAAKILSPEQIEKYLNTDWRAGVEIMMDQLLQWFNKKLRIRKLKNTGFKHACISAEEHVWVGIINGRPVLELLNPIKVFYHKSSEIEYVQDGYYAGYRTRMTPADVLDRYGDDLSDEDKEKLDKAYAMSNLYGITTDFLKPQVELLDLNKSLEWRMTKGATGVQTIGSYGMSTLNDVDVLHVEWRSQRKFGIITYMDESGEQQKDLLDESFKIPTIATKTKYEDRYGNKKTKYIWVVEDQAYEFEWMWLPEVWEGTRIADNIYVNIRPKPFQVRNLKDPYKAPLGYHGLAYNAMNAPNISIFDRGKPFQYLYFIIMHKMKEIVAKDMPPLSMIDTSMIPTTLSNEQWLYYYKQGLGFYNPNQNNEGNLPQSGTKGPAFEVQRSVMQHVNQYVELLAYIDEQINQVMGVSRQREGGTSSNEAVGNAQQNITQSSHITEILFQAHNSLWEQIMTSLIETAQLCYKDNPEKIPLVLDDMSRAIIEFNPEDLDDAELGAFLVDDPNDPQNLEGLRQMAMSFVQNGGTISDIAKLYRSTSMEALIRESEAVERARQQISQNQEQAQMEHEKALQESQNIMEETKFQHEKELKQMDIEGKIQVATIQVFSRQDNLDANSDGELDFIEAQRKERELLIKENIEKQKINANEKNDRERMQHEKEMKEMDVKMKEKDNATKIKVAKLKPKPTKTKK